MTRTLLLLVFGAAAMHAQTPQLAWSTQFGGSGETAMALAGAAMDSRGHTWMAGTVYKDELPVTPDAAQLRPNYTTACPACSYFEGYVMRLDRDGKLVYATWLGGLGDDSVDRIAVDAENNVYVAGHGPADGFPLKNALYTQGPGFLAKYSPDGALLFATRLPIEPAGLAAERDRVWVGGSTWARLETTPGAIQRELGALPWRRSTTSTVTWQSVEGLTSAHVLFASDAQDAAIVYARDFDELRQTTILRRSIDGGAAWTAVNSSAPYCAMGVRGQVIRFECPEARYRSDDGGRTVVRLPKTTPEWRAVAFDAHNPDIVWALARNGLHRSADGGDTWTRSSYIGDLGEMSAAYGKLYGIQGWTLYVITEDGYTSRDLPGEPRYIAADAQNPGVLYTEIDNSVHISRDEGRTWEARRTLPAGRIAATRAGLFAALISGRDAYLMRLSGAGTQLEYATYFGGSGDELLRDIALDASGNMHLGGETTANDLPLLRAGQQVRGGRSDLFAALFAGDGSRLIRSTYAGTEEEEKFRAMVAGGSGTTWVAGSWSQFRPAEYGWVYQIREDVARRIELGATTVLEQGARGGWGGSPWFVGTSQDPNIVTPDAYQRKPGGALLLRLEDPTGKIEYASYFGNEPTYGHVIAGREYIEQPCMFGFCPIWSELRVAGYGPVPVLFGSDVGRNWIARFTTRGASATPVVPANSVVNGASFRPATQPHSSVAPGTIASLFGVQLAPRPEGAGSLPLPVELQGTSVLLNGRAVPLFYVSPGQINFLVPWDTPAGSATVQVRNSFATSGETALTVAAVSPGIFLRQPGTAAALAYLPGATAPIRLESPVPPGTRIALYATGLGPLEQQPAPGADAGAVRTTLTVKAYVQNQSRGEEVEIPVEYAGSAPGFAGLYQVNVLIPPELAAGRYSLRLILEFISSNLVMFEVAGE